MVFQDINYSQIQVPSNTIHPAKIIDRVFSFVIDYLVISPFIMFALYLVFNNGFVFAKNNPLAAENDLFYILMAVSFLLLFSLVQVLFVEIWRATPGQYFLKLRFEFDDVNSLSLVRLYFRQILFWFSFLLLGVPFLSVLTNKRRRTFYDQVADVSVVTAKAETFSFTFEHEFKYWRALVATLTVFFIFIFSTFVWTNYKQIVGRAVSFAQMQEKKFFCDGLETFEYDKRLEAAVALNLVNQLSDQCLDREADFVLWKQKYDGYSMAYYAKSLTAEDSEKEQQYLTKACEGQDGDEVALGCKVAKAFESQQFEELYMSLNEEGLLADVLKYEIALKLDKTDDAAANFENLAQYNSLKPMRKYQLLEMLSEGDVEEENQRAPASVPDTEIEAYTKLQPTAQDSETQIRKSDRHGKIMELLGDL